MSDTDGIEQGAPQDVVQAWWQALQDHDLDRLATLLAEDHISVAGPDGRTVGRRIAIDQAARFLADGHIHSWSLQHVVERRLGPTAVCSYHWAETGEHAGRTFRMRGLATDVLVRMSHGWVIAAHHASVAPEGDAP